MTKDTSGRKVKVNPQALGVREFLFVALILVCMVMVLGCQKKDKAAPVPPTAEQKTRKLTPADGVKSSVLPGQTQTPPFHSILTKDLNRPIPVHTFSRNDRIYLLTVWNGLKGPHEIKVLWIRPDKTVQETVRLKENISSQNPTFTSWAYLSFTKGLLNISPLEGKFVGAWKAQLFLDGKFLKEFDFTVY